MKTLHGYIMLLFLFFSIMLLSSCDNTDSPTSPVENSQVALLKSGANASGGGTTVEGGEKSTFAFNAVQHKDGSVTGHLMYNIRGFDVSVHAKLDCINISGNTAVCSGEIVKVDGEDLGFIFVGERVLFTVEDNGQGKNSLPDLFSDVFIGPNLDCDSGVPAPYLPIDGNIQVK
jgi:hypothetical protein